MECPELAIIIYVRDRFINKQLKGVRSCKLAIVLIERLTILCTFLDLKKRPIAVPFAKNPITPVREAQTPIMSRRMVGGFKVISYAIYLLKDIKDIKKIIYCYASC